MFYYLSGKGKIKKIISKTAAMNFNLSQFFQQDPLAAAS